MEASQKEYEFIGRTKRKIVFIGIMHRSLWNYRDELERAILSVLNKNAELKFYLSSPDSTELMKRAEDEQDIQGDWPNQIRTQISRFKDLKEKYPKLNLSVFTYDEYPVWHIIMRDEERALVGWYPIGHTGYDAPLYEMKCDVETSFFAPIERWMNSIERNAKRII